MKRRRVQPLKKGEDVKIFEVFLANQLARAPTAAAWSLKGTAPRPATPSMGTGKGLKSHAGNWILSNKSLEKERREDHDKRWYGSPVIVSRKGVSGFERARGLKLLEKNLCCSDSKPNEKCCLWWLSWGVMLLSPSAETFNLRKKEKWL